MIRLSRVAFSLAVILIGSPLCFGSEASHPQSREIQVKGMEGSTLQTMTLLPDGTVAALVAPSRYGDSGENAPSGVRLYDKAGAEIATWRVDFHAQSIAAGPNGHVFVGGDGQLAKFDTDGTLVATIELPHLKAALGDTEKLREHATQMQQKQEEQQEQFRTQFDDQKKDLEEKLAELRAKAEDDLTAVEKRRIKRFEQQLEQFEEISASFQVPSVDDLMKMLTDRLRIINGVTITETDVFVVTGATTGFGYSVWRMDHQFQNSKQVLGELRGCCGQMDVRAHGDELFVAENCGHRVGRYSRDGEPLGHFGQRAGRTAAVEALSVKSLVKRKSKPAETAAGEEQEECPGFGGCCNPMNVWVTDDNLVYTAESEGIIRCFTTEGDYRGLIGQARLTGGCKNVAVAASQDGNTVYFCDQPGQKIIVLSRDDAEAEPVEAGPTASLQ